MKNAIKTYTRQLIAAVGDLEAAASCCRVSKSVLGEYQDRNNDRYMPVDVALALEQVAQKPILTAALAAAQGYTLARADASPMADVRRSVAALSRHAGELVARHTEADEDGVLDQHERADLLRQAQQVSVALQEIASALSRGETTLKVVA